VHPRAALREEAADRRVLAERAEQLQPALADADGRRLDALLLDARAMLDPGAEQPLVGAERTVEILDGKADVMHRAGPLHAAIVFERLEATMRACAFALVLTAVLLAGCGSGSSKPSTDTSANGEASKSAAQVLVDARASVASASSAHVTGHSHLGTRPARFDLSLSTKGAIERLSLGDQQERVIRVGSTGYVLGNDALYRRIGVNEAAAKLLRGVWLQGPDAKLPLLITSLPSSPRAIFAQIAPEDNELHDLGVTKYHGQDVVKIEDPTRNATYYIAATGMPYPVAVVVGGGVFTFSRWNQPVQLAAPKRAVPFPGLGG
jgi:hypothetical protein